MGFAINTYNRNKNTVLNLNAIIGGQENNQVRTDLAKGSGIQTAGLLKYENSFCSTFTQKGFENQALTTEIGTLDSLEPKNLDGFRAFC